MMNLKRKLIKLLWFLFISTVICSCTNKELTRSQAEQIIKEKFQYPLELPVQPFITTAFVSMDDQNTDKISYFHDYFDKLQREGILTYTKEVDSSGSPYFWVFTVTFTDKGKPFVVGPVDLGYAGHGNLYHNVKTGYLNFGEITGIVERKEFNIAEVNYTDTTDFTPFGKFLGVQQSFSHTVTFTKYDDGWRINK